MPGYQVLALRLHPGLKLLMTLAGKKKKKKTDKGACEELGNSLAVKELGFEINRGPHI